MINEQDRENELKRFKAKGNLSNDDFIELEILCTRAADLFRDECYASTLETNPEVTLFLAKRRDYFSALAQRVYWTKVINNV